MFKLAERKQIKLRLGIEGPSGSGKTFTALRIASGLGTSILVGDTEKDSAQLYAGDFTFYHENIDPPFNHGKLLDLIDRAEKAGIDVLIVDSLSHFWMGDGGILDHVDDVAAGMKKPNSFAAWKKGSKVYNTVVNAITRANLHIIVCNRSKTKYEQTIVNGKQTVEKLGLAAQQRDDFEYELTMNLRLNQEHAAIVDKTRWSEVTVGQVIQQPGREFGERLLHWLDSGVEAEPYRPKTWRDTPYGEMAPDKQGSARGKIFGALAALNVEDHYAYFAEHDLLAHCETEGRRSLKASNAGQIMDAITHLQAATRLASASDGEQPEEGVV